MYILPRFFFKKQIGYDTLCEINVKINSHPQLSTNGLYLDS